MSIKNRKSKIENPKSSTSLAATLTSAFVVFTLVALLLVGSVQIGLNFLTQQEVVARRQQLIALNAANEVSGVIEQIFSALETAAQVGRPLTAQAGERQLLLQNLQTLQPYFREITLLNSRGQEVTKLVGQTIVPVDDLLDRANSDLFIQTIQNVKHISSVHIDEATGEPLVTLAVPLKNNFGGFQGVLLAEVSLQFMWGQVDALEIGQTGLAYVVDTQGNLIALGDKSGDRKRVLAAENVRHLNEVTEFIKNQADFDEAGAGISKGINGSYILGTHIPLGRPNWAVVTELPLAEAYQQTIWNIVLSAVSLLITTFVAGWIGVYIARRLAAPLLNLTQTATRIATGEPGLVATLEGPTEVSRLASAFNSMTAQLHELIDSLEQQVATRTQRLEIVTTLSEHLTAILDLNELLTELVKQVKNEFGYYHAHVYLLDEERQNLMMVAGVGEAGAQMKAAGHHIPLDAPTSLVARAARRGEVVSVANVRETPDWLANPLLPDTYAEMAVPIIVEGQVVGVLDVQQNQIAGLDDNDANLLRSLASQVAVAIRNARLFTEVETALASARAVQERYLEQSWEKARIVSHGSQYLYAQPKAPPLDDTKRQVLSEVQQQALAQDGPAVVALNDDDSEPRSLVAPIKLRNKKIGALQLHTSEGEQVWSEDDLAVIEAVVDQLGQTAENLRLFDVTRQRAGREQTIREITDKLRTAPDLEQLVTIATEELGKHLSVSYAELELGLESSSNDNGAAGTEKI